MKEDAFISKNQESWKMLEDYAKKLSHKSVSGLKAEEIKSFVYLFRKVSHHLSYARTHFPGSNVVVYLNQLLGKTHNNIYIRRKNSLKDFFGYCTRTFPGYFKTFFPYILGAFLIFMAGACTSFIATKINIHYAYFFLPEDFGVSLETTGRDWDFAAMSSYIMTNNIRVSCLAMAWGFFLGIGTVYVLLINGFLLGALTAFVSVTGESMLAYWSLILPHGVMELTAIFISGGIGLYIGKSILVPGPFSRKYSLIMACKKVARLILGIVLLLVIAGLIEGFFTPLDISPWLKIAVALFTGILLIVYFGFLPINTD